MTHEFGATINHPGGTPYKIIGEGKAIFLKKGDPSAIGVTKPHVINIPERSFIRSTLHEQRDEIIALKKKLLGQILDGKMNTEKALGILGAFLADKIKLKIVAIKDPPNKASTIRKKGTSNPLIETGQLRNSITYEVNK